MTNRELYQETFARVHPGRRWTAGDLAALAALRRRRRVRRAAALAAAVALLAALSTAAVAGNWFGLRELLLPQAADLGVQAAPPVDVIGLQGYAGSPESRAMADWQAFLAGYDTDGALLAQVGNDPTGLEDRYGLYLVYTREMADRLEEITAQYGLALHTRVVDLLTREDLEAQAGGDFLGPLNRPYSTYMYEDGTFHFDGEADLPGYGQLDYQFMRCVKGSFTDVLLTVGDAGDYREWAYPAACGEAVTLALGPEKALLVADLGDSFVTVNVLAGAEPSEGGLTAEDLEALADSLDLSLLTPVFPPAEGPAAGETEYDAFLRRSGVRQDAAETFYRSFFTAVENDDRAAVAALVQYPRLLTLADGEHTVQSAEELLPDYDALFTDGLRESLSDWYYQETLAEGGLAVDLIVHDGMIGAANGAVWFAPVDGELRLMTVQNGEGVSLRYGGPAGGHGGVKRGEGRGRPSPLPRPGQSPAGGHRPPLRTLPEIAP